MLETRDPKDKRDELLAETLTVDASVFPAASSNAASVNGDRRILTALPPRGTGAR